MSLPWGEVLLLRHGIAEERAEGVDDATRALTLRGRERTWAVLERAASFGLTADHLWSSPLTRARQTAEIAVATGMAPTIALSDALAPGADPLPLLRQAPPAPVTRDGGAGRLLLVGHEPDLGLLACHLVGAPPGAITLRKAGLALLRLAPPGGERRAGGARLLLLLAPKLLLG